MNNIIEFIALLIAILLFTFLLKVKNEYPAIDRVSDDDVISYTQTIGE